MTKLREQIQAQDFPMVLSDTELGNLISGTDHRRYGLLKRAVANGDLIRLRRGLYCQAGGARRAAPDPYALSERIYGPSYVSFESALSSRGWIPESVPTVCCACTRRSREFETPRGRFSFVRVPARVFFAQVERIASGPDLFFMAQPWRAIADYIYANRKEWRGLHPLIHSLRIDEEELRTASRAELEELDRSFGKRRISAFIRGVLKELRL